MSETVRVRFTEDRKRMFEVRFNCPGEAPCARCTKRAMAYPSSDRERSVLALVFGLGPNSTLVLQHA